MKEAIIEKMYSILKDLDRSEAVGVKKLSIELECSMAYISHVLKIARVCGFIDRDLDVNMKINNLPEKPIFLRMLKEEIREKRKVTKGTGIPRGKRKTSLLIAENMKFSEKNIVSMIQKIIDENSYLRERVKEITAKNEKMKNSIKKFKSALDEATRD